MKKGERTKCQATEWTLGERNDRNKMLKRGHYKC